MKTETTTLTQVLQVWAIPVSAWMRKQYPDKPHFNYEVKTNKPWDEGAVKVHEAEVKIVIPAGIDITKAAIETLREAQKEVRIEADTKINELNERINDLLMLEYKPNLEVVDNDN